MAVKECLRLPSWGGCSATYCSTWSIAPRPACPAYLSLDSVDFMLSHKTVLHSQI